ISHRGSHMASVRPKRGGAAACVLAALVTGASLLQPPPPRVAQPVGGPRVDAHGDALPARAVARLGTVRLRHARPVEFLALPPDAALLATGNNFEAVLQVWQTATGKRVLLRPVPEGFNMLVMAFTPDGKTLATSDEDGSLCLWDPHTGKRLTAIKGDPAYTLAFGPDGKVLAATGHGAPVRLWEVTRGPGAGGAVGLRPHNLPEGPAQGARVLAFSKDGKLLAAGASDGGLCLWDMAAGKRLCYHRWAAVQARAAGFDANGRPLVIGAAPSANGVHILN